MVIKNAKSRDIAFGFLTLIEKTFTNGKKIKFERGTHNYKNYLVDSGHYIKLGSNLRIKETKLVPKLYESLTNSTFSSTGH